LALLDYCAYLVAGAEAEEPDETGRRLRRRFLLPIPALEIVDDWHVLGLAGTGSKSLRGEGVFVPEWRSMMASSSAIPAPAARCTATAISIG